MRGTPDHAVWFRRRGGIIPAYAGNTMAPATQTLRERDHPRVCGEHWQFGAESDELEGSSPRMRGTRDRHRSADRQHGIIPAYAGNTYGHTAADLRYRDHPRVCGEHTLSSTGLELVAGSSPRMRGTLHATLWYGLFFGIIPAYAGNTIKPEITLEQMRDHPRVCGEHRPRPQRMALRWGSSPRMRGTPCAWPLQTGVVGIIPAYAGNTLSGSVHTVTPEDHPRVCGEHLNGHAVHVHAVGSSPRMRGTRARGRWRAGHGGIIPAYAGNTCRRLRHIRLPWDHPRVCGEHHDMKVATFPSQGSSPRMRGTLRHVRGKIVQFGIIPAYAGNTDVSRNRLKSSRDHPRVCGEHVVSFRIAVCGWGSSPRMRGTLR